MKYSRRFAQDLHVQERPSVKGRWLPLATEIDLRKDGDELTPSSLITAPDAETILKEWDALLREKY